MQGTHQAPLPTQLFANESVPEHVGYAKVKITLINENDNRPVFSQPLYNVSLYENVTVGTSVLTVLVSVCTPAEFPHPPTALQRRNCMEKELGKEGWAAEDVCFLP